MLYGFLYAAILAIGGYVVGFVVQLLSSSQLVSLSVANVTRDAMVYHIAESNYAQSTVYPYLFALIGLVVGLTYGVLRELSND
ncbi:hypothetical protein [Metallosphaera sp.]|uniref:hypothetical protein n=1 Tax=Metallosphaera sp. TaxID=2020860 RepID=UPI00317EFD58